METYWTLAIVILALSSGTEGGKGQCLAWSECSASCGKGIRTLTITQECNLGPCPKPTSRPPRPTEEVREDLECDGGTIDVCKEHSASWKVAHFRSNQLQLSDCRERKPKAGDKLLLFVSRGVLDDYGKYQLVKVKKVKNKGASVCQVTLDRRIRMPLEGDQNTCFPQLIAQTFPQFDKVSLRNKCVLTCNGQKDGLGGILAFRAKRLFIDQTSKIDMSGKGKCKLLSCTVCSKN